MGIGDRSMIPVSAPVSFVPGTGVGMEWNDEVNADGVNDDE
jgi:hypothetical protein